MIFIGVCMCVTQQKNKNSDCKKCDCRPFGIAKYFVTYIIIVVGSAHAFSEPQLMCSFTSKYAS